MSKPFIESIDTSILESRFSTEDTIAYLTEPSQEEIEAAFEALQPLLKRLPQREQDLLFMHYVMKKKQTELGMIFGRTQAAISYRLKKAVQRIKFLRSIPQVDADDIERDLSGLFSEHDMSIMLGMFKHTCQTQVAKDIGSNQCHVRHRFHRNIQILGDEKEYDDKYEPYYDLFSKIRDNTNILREVKLSRWNNSNYMVDADV
tara:strand:+ start:6228 stop:6836 length:609 start_codon:yes stop_codon:yes gene_type:complete